MGHGAMDGHERLSFCLRLYITRASNGGGGRGIPLPESVINSFDSQTEATHTLLVPLGDHRRLPLLPTPVKVTW